MSVKSKVDKSIAVLPFVNMSADRENEYFSDGITEEIINALTTIQDLKVIARTSSFAFKDKQVDVRVIGNQLGVSTVLEGSVRKVDNRVRITAQLINTADGSHFWSKNFDRELKDIFALQDEISLLIADKIRENFGHMDIQDHLVTPKTSNIESYELYLRGRFFFFKWNLPDIEKAISFFSQSIALSPEYDQPYFGIGLCYSLLGSWGYFDKLEAFQRADAYFNKGLKLGKPSLLRYFTLAAHQFWGSWDYPQAYKNLQSAHKLNPQNPDPLDFMAEINGSLGDFETATELNQKALQFNPLSVNAHHTRSSLLYLQEKYQESRGFIQQGLLLDPNFELLQHLYSIILIQLGQKEELYNYLQHEEVSPMLVKLAKLLYDLFHQETLVPTHFDAILHEIDTLESPLLYPWDIYLLLHATHQERAMALLEKKVRARVGQVICFKKDPLLKPLQDHTVFLQLIAESFSENSISPEPRSTPNIKARGLNSDEITEFIAALSTKMEGEQIYTDPSLTLRTLADAIDIHPNKLSWLLNNQVGKSFNDYVNGYRLKTFQQKALEPDNDHLTLLGIAFESGFNSKSAFNDFFKKMTGLSPKAWLKKTKKS